MLNVRGRFGPPAFVPVLNNLLVSAILFTYARTIGTQGLDLDTGARLLLGAGTTAGVVVQALVLLPYLRGEKLRLRFDLRDAAVTRAVKLAAFVVGYVAINQVGLWVVLVLANGEPGGVTSWQVAYMFFQLPHGLFAVSLYTVLLPDLSRAAGASDWDAYRRNFRIGVRGVAYLLLPAAVGYAILARPVTRLLLARGVADASDAAAVASVLEFFTIGLVFFSTFHLLTRSFYALPDTRTPTALNALAVGVNIAVNFPLYAWLGVRGLALGHAIGYAVGTFLLATVLHRRIPGGLGLGALAAPVARTGAVAAAMGACVWLLMAQIRAGDLAVVGACVTAGAILYLTFSQVARVEELKILVGLVRRSSNEEEQ